MWPFSTPELKSVVEHRASRDRLLLADDVGGSEAGDLDILSSDIAGLVEGIKSRRWTASVVLKAFIRSARRSQAESNFMTEVNFAAALKRAAELDAHFESTETVVGPLHGVPMSLKDQFGIKGLHSTLGYSEWIKRGPAKEEASIVKIAQSLGAIFICKTNVPQTMLAIESRNPVWLQTSNPWSKAFGCGGSSGGEAVALASDACALGIGSDIGGSLRIPAHFCGTYSLKPSIGKWPMGGSAKTMEGFDGINTVAGPMARSAADLELAHRLFMEVLHPEKEDSENSTREIQQSWGAEDLIISPLRPLWFNALAAAAARKYRPKLRFGYYYNDGFTVTSPACIRAVKEVKEALESKHGDQVELVEISPKELQTAEAARVFLGLVSAEGYWGRRRHIGPDATDSGVKFPFFLGRIPRFIRSVLVLVIGKVAGDSTLARVLSGSGRKSAQEYMDFVKLGQKQNFIVNFDKRIFDGYKLDGVIAPVLPTPAMKHYGTSDLSAMAASTFLYNVTDSAAAVVPVTRVDRDRDFDFGPAWQQTPGTELCSKLSKARIYGGSRPRYTPEMHGLPVCVQVIARPHEEVKAIGMMRVIDDALGPRAFGPGYYARAKSSAVKA